MYADSAYYAGDFKGTIIPTETVETALEFASDLIDEATFGRIPGKGFDNLTANQQGKIKRACCLIAEDVHASGVLASGGPAVSGFSLGDFSVQEAKDTAKIGGIPVRKIAISLLRQTGLTYAGVG